MTTETRSEIKGSPNSLTFAAAAILLSALGGCSALRGEALKGAALEDYCAIEANARKDLCKVNNGINDAKGESRRAVALSGEAKTLAERAQTTADRALATAQAAPANGSGQLQCETRTLRRQVTGSCQQGYTLVSCHQSRYTYRAGRPSILRDISDTQCRFAAPVLEMKVRCCQGVATASISPSPQAGPTSTRAPGTS